MFASVCVCSERVPVCTSLCVSSVRVHVCFSLSASSKGLHECQNLKRQDNGNSRWWIRIGELRLGGGIPRVSVWLHQCVCQFRESVCLFWSECQFRESACLLQSECQSFKKQCGRNSRWQTVCQLIERVHVCYSLYVCTCLHQSVYLFRMSICLH